MGLCGRKLHFSAYVMQILRIPGEANFLGRNRAILFIGGLGPIVARISLGEIAQNAAFLGDFRDLARHILAKSLDKMWLISLPYRS